MVIMWEIFHFLLIKRVIYFPTTNIIQSSNLAIFETEMLISQFFPKYLFGKCENATPKPEYTVILYLSTDFAIGRSFKVRFGENA
ncbi:hypothetical protein C8N25_102195 [Algoriphagus antarcticus]|uniref:Uncharacterized protein n=1 Tax=Algoriphagus antarcticus TaxID=238540 RepID=A0A3E0E3D5_9BACT|nr:hypothetical protein C8N25_102195 [Algoriphagus antarcticus]